MYSTIGTYCNTLLRVLVLVSNYSISVLSVSVADKHIKIIVFRKMAECYRIVYERLVLLILLLIVKF